MKNGTADGKSVPGQAKDEQQLRSSDPKLITDKEDIKVMKAGVVCDLNPTKIDEMAVSTGEILSVQSCYLIQIECCVSRIRMLTREESFP